MTDTPPEIARFLALIGEDATLKLLERHGGTRVLIRTGSGPRNGLARLLGREAAAALAAEFGAEIIRVPLAKRWRACRYRAAGMSYTAIAHKLGCSDVTVWEYVRRAQPAAQLALALE